MGLHIELPLESLTAKLLQEDKDFQSASVSGDTYHNQDAMTCGVMSRTRTDAGNVRVKSKWLGRLPILMALRNIWRETCAKNTVFGAFVRGSVKRWQNASFLRFVYGCCILNGETWMIVSELNLIKGGFLTAISRVNVV